MSSSSVHTGSEILVTDESVIEDLVERRTAVGETPLPKLEAIVKGKDHDFQPWSEKAQVTSLSSSGAGLFMSVPCTVGCLISLLMPVPTHLRKYDLDKRLYRVWGLVQYCYEAGGTETAGFHVGVALIGKDAPASYTRHPMQSYRVCGMDSDGLWTVEELKGSFRQRSSVRYWNSIEVSLYQLDDEMNSTISEQTVTENISESGASVFSGLLVESGDRIKFKSISPRFTSLAVVRRRRVGDDKQARIHLEFVENSFPILDIEAPIEETGDR